MITVTSTRDEFLRRYATSPIHVPRLERLLEAYGDDEQNGSFSRNVITWDRACRDVEAARIVTEILSVSFDGSGRIVRVSDDAVKGAIRWMADAGWLSVADRATMLADALSTLDRTACAKLGEFLETCGALDDDEFRTAAQSF